MAAYASTVTWDTMDEYERHIKECMDEGFFAFKLHASGDAKWDAKLSLSLRKWVGDGPDLMFDASGGWDYVTSLWFGHVLEEADFLWYEEPMREYDLPSYAELCAALDIPILGRRDLRRGTLERGLMDSAARPGHGARLPGQGRLHGRDEGRAHGRVVRHARPTARLRPAPGCGDPQQRLYRDPGDRHGADQGAQVRDEIRVVDGYSTTSDEPGVGPQPDWKKIEAEAVAVA